MNRRNRMRAEILQHGIKLQMIFGIAEIEPVELAKKIHRYEAAAHRLAEDYCNGLIDTEDWYDIKEIKILKRLDKLLGFRALNIPVFVNADPRGYALKIDEAYVREHNMDIHRDWGGYGILAPDFDGSN